MAEPLSFADYAQELRLTANVIRDDLNDTIAASAKLIAEAQLVREQRCRNGFAINVLTRNVERLARRKESAS